MWVGGTIPRSSGLERLSSLRSPDTPGAQNFLVSNTNTPAACTRTGTHEGHYA
jgi:hypothetical protein